MKRIIILLLLFFGAQGTGHQAFAQPGEWVWLHGSNVANGAVNYGVQGVPSPTNDPPSVYEPCEWRDASGNFWLYGGTAAGQFFADLWKYDPLTNEWTWVKGPGTVNYLGSYGVLGVPSPTNNPPSKSYCTTTWTDLAGDLWLFGGLNITGQSGSDLWKYTISTNEWTWMNGLNTTGQAAVYGTQGVPSILNTPGDRWECASSWTDGAGDLWLFGGYQAAGTFNDMWRFHIATGEWTWMKGDNFTGGTGIAGVRGVEDPANAPGSRATYTHWKDGNGYFWFFGGYEFTTGTNLNDLWRYNTSTNAWTWMTGSIAGNANSVYGAQCGADSLSTPGGRYECRCVWTDQLGNFWLFGGRNCCLSSEMWNDLWTYCIETNKWTWVSGQNTANPAGNWGTINVSSPANHPNSRAGAVSWSDDNGHLYLFGGSTFPYPTPFNDLWKFTIDYSCISCSVLPNAIFTSPNHICPGTCTDFTNLSSNATSYQWDFPGGNPFSSTDIHPLGICYATPGTYDVTLIAANANGSDTLTLPNYITVFPYPSPQGITQNGDTLFANQGAVSYQWYYNGTLITGATEYFFLAMVSGDYNVVATDANGCEVEAVIFDVIAGLLPALSEWQGALVFPNPVADKLIIQSRSLSGAQVTSGTTVEISIFTIMGSAVFLPTAFCLLPRGFTLDGGHASPPAEVDVRALSPGMYFLKIADGSNYFRIKFIKE